MNKTLQKLLLMWMVGGLAWMPLGCAPRLPGKAIYSTETGILMGTNIQLGVCHLASERRVLKRAYSEVWESMQDIHWRMNVFHDKSEVAQINRSYYQPVAVSPDTYELIEESVNLSLMTSGAFDITVFPLIELWRKYAKLGEYPPAEEISQVKAAIGGTHLALLDRNQVQVLHERTKIDLGAIAKGYAVDEAARIFRKNGFSNFFIDAGGDVYAGGLNCEGQKWKIGIKDPRDTEKLIEVVEISNVALATSGNYEQFFEIKGQQWSHIINPITGYPQQTIVSASVIAPTATMADALATALTILGPREGLDLVDSLGESFGGLVFGNVDEQKLFRGESQQFKEFRSILPKK